MIFNQISSTVRTPGAYGEFDASRARPGSSTKPRHALLLAHKLSGGSATAATAYEITGGIPQADSLAGVGSMAAECARAFLTEFPDGELTMICPAEPSGGALSAGTLVFTGPATADGYVYLYVAGRLVQVTVTSGDSANTVATAVYNAINLDTRLPIVATNATPGTTTLASRWKGTSANDILVELNRLSTQALPTGIACTVTTMASGSGTPQIAAAIAAIPEASYDRIISGFNDDTTLDLIEAEALARWNAMVQLETIVHSGWRGTYGDAATYGAARNSAYSTVVCIEKSPTAPWIAAASYAGVAAQETDPARPLNGLALSQVVPPKISERYTRTERDALLHLGLATTKTVGDSQVIERAITTYQTNTAAVADDTYLDLTTPQTLAYLRWDWNAYLAANYPRHKLADDDTRVDPDQPVVTPKSIKGEAMARGQLWERRGLIENYADFEAGLVVERNALDPNRLDIFMPPDLVNGAHVFATKVGFIL